MAAGPPSSGGKKRPQSQAAHGKSEPAAKKQRYDKKGPPASSKPQSGSGYKGKPSGSSQGPRKGPPGADKHKQADAVPLSKLSKQERKQRLREKNAAIKKNFTLIQDAVVLWEALRPKQASEAEKAELVGKILSKVDGKLVELAAHHTASRIIQFCVKHGTPAHRKLITDQTKNNAVELAKSKYGHHLVKKLIATTPKDQISDIVKMFQGHMVELLRHPHGADVLVDLYDVANTATRNSMCAEFFGREFALFGGVHQQGSSLTSLSALLAGQPVGKRRKVMQHLTKALVPIMEKGILHPPMVHRLLRDFIECGPSMSVEDAVDTLTATGASLLKMVHTHDGAAVVCALLGYGSAKDRKRVVKAMKGHVSTMAVNEWAHTVLIQALSVLDDTSLAGKIICAELKAMMTEAVEDKYASRVLLQLLCPYSTRYLSPAVLAMLQLPARTVKGSTGKMVTELEGEEEDDELQGGLVGGADDDDDGDGLFKLKSNSKSKASKAQDKKRKAAQAAAEADDGSGDEAEAEQQAGGERVLGLSKKDNNVRRRELLSAGGREPLVKALVAACAENAGALLRTPGACDLVVEVARCGEGGLLQELAPEGVQAVHQAIVAEAQGSAAGSTGPAPAAEPQAEHVFTHYYGSRALRRLLLISAEEGAETGPATQFAELLWSEACQGKCKQWMGGHGEKILASLLHCGSASVRGSVTKELKPLVKPQDPEAWSAKFIGQGHHEQHKKAKAGGGGAPSAAAAVAETEPAVAAAKPAATPAKKGKQEAVTPKTGKKAKH